MQSKDVLIGVLVTLLVCGSVAVIGLQTGMLPTDRATVEEVSLNQSVNGSTVTESVVAVSVNTTDSELRTIGSGFVYDEEYIVTNEHVVEDYQRVRVQYYNGEWSNATVVGADKYTDIAVLRPETRPTYAKPLRIADEVAVGTRVYAVGSPDGYDWTVTSGIVSGVERASRTDSGFTIPDMVQTDAALNGGNSGGPLVTQNEGIVVGVNRETQGENLGFAVSSRLTNHVAQSIIETGDHTHPYVGIQMTELTPFTENTSEVTVSEGLIVRGVIDETPAYETLNADENLSDTDIILEVDGRSVTTNQQLSRYLMLNKSPNDRVTMTILRNGTRQDVAFNLGTRP